VIAFAGSFLIALLATAAIVAYGKRRPVGAPLSWGEAIAAATLGFGLMFWAYGVVPHQWLTYSGNELNWSPAKQLVGAGQWEFLGAPLPPFTMSYETLAHFIVVGIYGLFLGMHVAMWAIWQNRAKEKPKALPTSQFGRPLVRQA
jgi:hypothetical protein